MPFQEALGTDLKDKKEGFVYNPDSCGNISFHSLDEDQRL